jgi:PKHD-type hydroxylase
MTYWSIELDKTHPYAYSKGVFTPEECQQIIDFGNSKRKTDALVDCKQNAYKPELRKNKLAWLEAEPELVFAYRRLIDVGTDLNKQFFGFDLIGITEKLQFTEYKEGDFFKMHYDKTYDNVIRKLSIVIMLSDPNTYEGGELNLWLGDKPDVAPKEQGTVIAFPSYIMHEVLPVTKGLRYTIVAWFGGPNLK